MHPNVHSSVTYNCQDTEANLSVHQQTSEENKVWSIMEYYSVIKTKEILPFATTNGLGT